MAAKIFTYFEEQGVAVLMIISYGKNRLQTVFVFCKVKGLKELPQIGYKYSDYGCLGSLLIDNNWCNSCSKL